MGTASHANSDFRPKQPDYELLDDRWTDSLPSIMHQTQPVVVDLFRSLRPVTSQPQ